MTKRSLPDTFYFFIEYQDKLDEDLKERQYKKNVRQYGESALPNKLGQAQK